MTLLVPFQALAGGAQPILLGHNLTPTPYTLRKGDAIAGTYAIGYGVTDDFMVSTSPFIWVGYGMAMANARYRFYRGGPDVEGVGQRFETTFEPMYFKTFGFSRYHQESVFLRLTGAAHLSKDYTFILSTGHQYFWDDTHPYSLNPRAGLQKYLPSISMLHEFHIMGLYGILFEMGTLALNYPEPYSHVGVSGFYKNTWLLIQLGISRTAMLPNRLGLYHWITHPETQVQFYFAF